MAASKGAVYMRRRRAEGKAWDQQPENCEKVRERKRQWVHERRWTRIDAGLCANCGQPKLSEWYCWECLDKKAFGAILATAREWGLDVADADLNGDLQPLREIEKAAN